MTKLKIYKYLKIIGKYIIILLYLILWLSIWINVDIIMHWESTLNIGRLNLCTHCAMRENNISQIYLILFIIFFGIFIFIKIKEYFSSK
jgi:hypothetical protein